MAKRGNPTPQKPQVADAAAFRRLLHSQGPVSKGLNAHRERLAPTAVVEVVAQLFATPVYASAFATNPFPTRFEAIKPRRALAPASPQLDLIWNAAVLGRYAARLAAYVTLRDAFYDCISGAAYDTAHELLAKIESEFGVSIWLAFSRLLLIQQSRGLAAQKRYLQEIVERPTVNPFFAYLAFYFSFGLEDNVSVTELNRELDQLSDAGAPEGVVGYFRYHASPLGLSAVGNPYNCITLEENSPIIDRFETYCEMSQLIADDPLVVSLLENRSVESAITP